VYQASQLARATNGEPQPWQPDGTHAAK
jgi:hypothetical protein